MSQLLRQSLATEELREELALKSANTQGQEDMTDQGGAAGQTVLMKGPLADAYTQALDIAYAKADPAQSETEQPALETQAMDAQVAQQLAQSLVNTAPASPPATVVYAVNQSKVTEDDLVSVTSDLGGQEKPGDYILIVDATQPSNNGDTGLPQERVLELNTALECIVEAHGGRVFHSLGAYLESRKK